MPQRVAFVFSARETPWPGMGASLLEETGVIRDVLEKGEAIIAKRLDVSLRSLLASRQPFPEAMLTPINAVTQIALTAEWRERGIDPSALVCRCSGEFAAGYVSGAISFEDALEPPCRVATMLREGRGRGQIVVAWLPWAEAEALRADCPIRYEVLGEAQTDSVAIGCKLDEGRALRDFFSSRRILAQVTPLTIASHTWLIEDCMSELVRPLTGAAQPARIPVYSATARGRLLAPDDYALHFWRVMRENLSIRDAFAAALDDGESCFVEVGGQPTLRRWIETVAEEKGVGAASFATMERNRPLRSVMDATLIRMHHKDACVV